MVDWGGFSIVLSNLPGKDGLLRVGVGVYSVRRGDVVTVLNWFSGYQLYFLAK